MGRPRPDECSSGSPLSVYPRRSRLEPRKSEIFIMRASHNKEGGFLYFQKNTARKRKPVGWPRPYECTSGSPLSVPPRRSPLGPGKSEHFIMEASHNKEGGFLDFQKITAWKRKPVGRPKPDECSSGSPLSVYPRRSCLEPGKSEIFIMRASHNKEGGFLARGGISVGEGRGGSHLSIHPV